MEKNNAEALKWYRKAAEQNEPNAENNLGLCYFNGQGVEKDYAEASTWFRKAAAQNNADAQINLGVCYANGKGVVKNVVEAYGWFNLAATSNEAGAKARDELERAMTPQQVSEAQTRTKELRAQIDAALKSANQAGNPIQ